MGSGNIKGKYKEGTGDKGHRDAIVWVRVRSWTVEGIRRPVLRNGSRFFCFGPTHIWVEFRLLILEGFRSLFTVSTMDKGRKESMWSPLIEKEGGNGLFL
jgi:hypothetical protein